jgi:hypothetical protein
MPITPSYAGNIGRRIVVQSWPGQKVKYPIRKITTRKKELET